MTKVEIFEGDRASQYNDFVGNWIPNYHYFLETVPQILSDVTSKNLLVAGCGTGNEIESFKQKLSNWKITGIDPSVEMLSQAKEKFKSHSNIHLELGTVDMLPETNKFDASTLLLVMHFLPDNGDKLSILKEINVRLKPNAPFILLDITGSREQIIENLQILSKLLPNSVEEELKEIRINRILNELHPVSENRIIELFEEAGFSKPTRFFQSTIYMGWMTKKSI